MRQNGTQRNSRQGYLSQRSQQHSLDSPPRLKRSGGPAMSAERFLLMVEQLKSRASELWEQEQLELRRGAELMVICCAPSDPSPQHQQHQQPSGMQQADNAVTSPVCPFDHPLLHSHASVLQSPSLIAAAHQFNSPGPWGNDFDAAIAVSLGFPSAANTSEELPDVGPSSLHLHGHEDGHGGSHGNQQSGPWPPLSAFHDVEALITLQNGPLFCSSGGGSATARTAKARLLDRFDGSLGGGTATATQQQQSASPFLGIYSCTPGADDFLGSPQSWARAYL